MRCSWDCRNLSRRLRKCRSGAVATEYAFVIAFVAIVSATGMSAMGVSVKNFFNDVGSTFAEAGCKMPANASSKGQGKSNKCKGKTP